MVVDDDIGMRTTLGYILEEEGYKVLEGEDGLDAIQAAKEKAAKVFIMDVKMSHVDGIEACRTVHQYEPDATVFLITAYMSARSEVEAAEAGARALLYKPLKMPQLLDLVSDVWQRPVAS